MAGAAVLFTACTREEPLPARAPLPVKERLAAFTSALRDHDVRWAFTGRALLVLGYFAVSGYELYVLQDHTVLPDGMEPEAAVAVLMPLTSIAMVVSTVLGGYLSDLSDRLHRREPFVGACALLSAVALAIPAASDSRTAVLAFTAVNGLAFGSYLATALFVVAAVLAVAGALAVKPTRSVR
ncbi:hypothetical protein [Streptomyces sp. NPDC051109]|uniref:hypothetical protein n=1 Tax=Streptomyces sp. NPDC051109 TaxID=3365642 RepID=UPI00267DAA56